MKSALASLALVLSIGLAGGCAAPLQSAPSPPPARAAPYVRAPPPVEAAPGRPAYADDALAPRADLDGPALERLLAALRVRDATPRPAPALDRAAVLLATSIADGDPAPLSQVGLQRALRRAAAFDPAPRVHAASGAGDEPVAALLSRLAPGNATHVGIGATERDGRRHVVLLLSRRRARIDPFPSSVAPGAVERLSGALVGLLHPRAFVTRPDGSTEEIPLEGGATFAARVPFPSPGTHLLEVTGTGPAGTEVAALLAVTAGSELPDPTASPGAGGPDPADPAEAEAAVAAAINRLRRDRGVEPLPANPALAAVARRHSERMLAAGVVAHVLPGSGEPADRLAAARIPYARALENVARGESALAAHAAAEASPAHRANLLAADASTLGVGIARGTLPSGEPITYLTELLVVRPPSEEPDRMAPDARVRETLWRERERRALPPLTDDPALAALALDAARAARDADGGETGTLAEAALRLGRALAAADAFVAAGPSEATRSRNLTDPRFRRVGVGVVRGDSRRYGPGRLFIAVVYSD